MNLFIRQRLGEVPSRIQADGQKEKFGISSTSLVEFPILVLSSAPQ